MLAVACMQSDFNFSSKIIFLKILAPHAKCDSTFEIQWNRKTIFSYAFESFRMHYQNGM